MVNPDDVFAAVQALWPQVPAVTGGLWMGRASEEAVTPYGVAQIEEQDPIFSSGPVYIARYKLTLTVWSAQGVMNSGNINRQIDVVFNRQNAAALVVAHTDKTIDIIPIPGKIEVDEKLLQQKDVLVAAKCYQVWLESQQPTASRFLVSGPASTTAGSTVVYTVTALDAYCGAASPYSGTLHFTSSDTGATLAINQALHTNKGTFSATLATAGNQTITAADTVTATILGTLVVTVGTNTTCTHFSFTGPAAGSAGNVLVVTVTALTSANATATTYAGTVQFTTADTQATLAANRTLTSGKGTFSATLVAQGTQTVGVSDSGNSGISGLLSVVMGPGSAAAFLVTDSGGGVEVQGVPFSITARCVDAYGNFITSTNYPPGSAAIIDTSDDANWTNPSFPYTATGNNWVNGSITISGCNYTALNGALIITFADNANSAITGALTLIVS